MPIPPPSSNKQTNKKQKNPRVPFKNKKSNNNEKLGLARGALGAPDEPQAAGQARCCRRARRRRRRRREEERRRAAELFYAALRCAALRSGKFPHRRLPQTPPRPPSAAPRYSPPLPGHRRARAAATEAPRSKCEPRRVEPGPGAARPQVRAGGGGSAGAQRGGEGRPREGAGGRRDSEARLGAAEVSRRRRLPPGGPEKEGARSILWAPSPPSEAAGLGAPQASARPARCPAHLSPSEDGAGYGVIAV